MVTPQPLAPLSQLSRSDTDKGVPGWSSFSRTAQRPAWFLLEVGKVYVLRAGE